MIRTRNNWHCKQVYKYLHVITNSIHITLYAPTCSFAGVNVCYYHIFAECLCGFPTDLSVPRRGSGRQAHLLGGTFLFPNTTIQCYGNITSVRFAGYFNPNIRYNSTLSVQILFYTQAESHYMLATSTNLVLNLESAARTEPGLMTDPSGRYYVSSPLDFTSQFVLSEPLQVYPGYTLGVGLPPTESLPRGVVAHGVSIAVRDDTSSPAISVRQQNCWNPSAMRSEPCSVIRELVRPVVLLEFTEEGM